MRHHSHMAVPEPDCQLCPRLAGFRADNKIKFPDKYNAPVPSFGGDNCNLLVVGLAPGLKGANFTGRPFTGDYAGDLLYATLLEKGLASGSYQKHAGDGLTLHKTRITNAVRCVPPENKPTTEEIKTCGRFLKDEIAALPDLKIILALGLVAHKAVLRVFEKKQSAYAFSHGARHALGGGITLYNSYHCSRYNTQTGRLTPAMFGDVFDHIKNALA